MKKYIGLFIVIVVVIISFPFIRTIIWYYGQGETSQPMNSFIFEGNKIVLDAPFLGCSTYATIPVPESKTDEEVIVDITCSKSQKASLKEYLKMVWSRTGSEIGSNPTKTYQFKIDIRNKTASFIKEIPTTL